MKLNFSVIEMFNCNSKVIAQVLLLCFLIQLLLHCILFHLLLLLATIVIVTITYYYYPKLDIKESIQAYKIKLERETNCDEAVWCKIVSGNSTLTIGLVYRSPNINEEDNRKIQNAIKAVSKGECIII